MNLEKSTYEYKIKEELRRINEDKTISEENKKIISFFIWSPPIFIPRTLVF